ncbi:MAG: hypothetical protein ACK5UE_13625 [Chitinophagales bacterium]|jgi:hypothetical protein|nr:hypothetical protein [Sphingobacteriales bacterium]
MKKNIILSVPTAKIQIGNKAAITLDTASTNGKKSIQINIVTENDSINKVIDEITNSVSEEIESSASEIISDKKQEYYESQIELERIKNESLTEQMSVFIPIIAILGGFSYLAFRSYQKRKWREALLNKGFSLDEINQSEHENKTTIGSGPDELANYDKRKTLKYSIVFGSLGIAILFGTIMDDFGYLIGMLFALLGTGFWYYNEKIK